MARKIKVVVKSSPERSLASQMLTSFLRFLITVYRYTLSYFLGSRCRFSPTCSLYADKALALHGPFRGSWLALCRIGRCHPWGGSGYDPVPEKRRQENKDD